MIEAGGGGGGEGEDAPSQLHLIPPFSPSFTPLFTGSYLFSPPLLWCYSQSTPPEIYCDQSSCALPAIALRPPVSVHASTALKAASCTEQSNHHHFKRWKLDGTNARVMLSMFVSSNQGYDETLSLYVATSHFFRLNFLRVYCDNAVLIACSG